MDSKHFSLSQLKARREELIRELLYADDAAIVAHSLEGVKVISNRLAFAYLGNHVTSDNNIDGDIENRVQTASRSFGSLHKRLWSQHGITITTKPKVQKLLTIKWQDIVPITEVPRRAKMASEESMILTAQLRGSGHVARMEDCKLPKILLYGELRDEAGSDLTVVDLVSLERRVLKTGYAAFTMGVAYSLDGSKVYTVAADSLRGPRVVEVNVSSGEATPLGRWTAEGEEGSNPSHPIVDPHYISVARQIQFPTTQGDFAYGYLYMPKNKDYRAPPGTRPPLLVKAHGGPTAAATKTFSAAVQFFTSRGFAILDVDYRGSTGYGTLYRTKLHEMWGVYDVDDVLAGADYLVQEGLVDPERLCIDGGSAGGYTALSALTITGSKFKAGASFYGVTDLQLLARDTHKFESRYLDGLVGKLDKHLDRYVSRSPFRNHGKLDVPTVFFHGTEDTIVPPNQAIEMFQLLKGKGLPAAIMLFEGESHGFLKAENRKTALEAEIFFFSQVFNFTLGDVTSNLTIENLSSWRDGS
ncbi:acylamino-acid-releasing enzyme 2-like [Penaeus chinensis]|uniref:acylamino-acid-releasing enzyme 2-like n=1 Tax=Penaeus chinensis TaxID=139456 RepID=UPI001FB77ADC|nr:acylamino-acid-releasing enzyme 2-like [Penaeus chinensis]